MIENLSRSAQSSAQPQLTVVPDVQRAPGISWSTRIAKRTADLIVGTVLAVLALPVILVLAVGAWLSLRSWPFFVQRRVGRDGRTFPFLKLRTLPATTSPVVGKYELADVEVPAFCRFLRRVHLDELPQLLLILPGWMSLVGPRPELPAILAHYPADFAAARCRVRPGCTGLWQVSKAAAHMIYEAPEYDLLYLRSGGLRMDAWISLRTVGTLLSSRAYIELDDVPIWTMGKGYFARPHAQVDGEMAPVSTGEA